MNKNTEKCMLSALENFLDCQSRVKAFFKPGQDEIYANAISRNLASIIEYLQDNCKEDIDQIIEECISIIVKSIGGYMNSYIIPRVTMEVIKRNAFLEFRQIETVCIMGAIDFKLYRKSKEE